MPPTILLRQDSLTSTFAGKTESTPLLIGSITTFAGLRRRAAHNGLRYLRVGGCGFCLRAVQTQSQKQAWKARRIPHVRCTLCWAAISYFPFALSSIANEHNNRANNSNEESRRTEHRESYT